MKEYLELGQIVNTRGLRGEVKVNSFSEDPKRFEKLKKIIVKNKQGNTEYEIERVGYSKNQVILKLKGIDEYLEAAKNIKEKYPNTEFLIAGWNEEEEYKKIVEELIKMNI